MSNSGGLLSRAIAGDVGSTSVSGQVVDAYMQAITNSGTGPIGLIVASGVDGNNEGRVLAVQELVVTGAFGDRLRSPGTFKPISTLAVGAEATIWTPAAGKKFRLMGLVLALSAATTLTLKDNTAGTTIGRLLLPVGGPGAVVNFGNGILSAVANNVLTATSGAAANLDGMVFGTEE